METTVNGVVYEEVVTTQSIEDFSEWMHILSSQIIWYFKFYISNFMYLFT